MTEIISDLKEVSDVVIIDGPPFLTSDALILAGKVDGVLIAIRPGQVRREAIVHMKGQLQRAHVNVLGIVLNGVSPKAAYYSPYYVNAPIADQGGNGRAATGEERKEAHRANGDASLKRARQVKQLADLSAYLKALPNRALAVVRRGPRGRGR
jgi:Mrp family chromosome partitioning ATPase